MTRTTVHRLTASIHHHRIQLRDPAWFDPLSVQKKTTRFDKLSLLSASFSILKGGYAVYASEVEQRLFGDEFPQWRRDMKSGGMSRTSLHRAQAAGL